VSQHQSELVDIDGDWLICSPREPRFAEYGRTAKVEIMSNWDEIKAAPRRAQAVHACYFDSECPPIPDLVVTRANGLLVLLESRRKLPPTCVTGTMDGTVAIEWHRLPDDERNLQFISVDVHPDDYEVCIIYAQPMHKKGRPWQDKKPTELYRIKDLEEFLKVVPDDIN
jgi:hypothetical protein